MAETLVILLILGGAGMFVLLLWRGVRWSLISLVPAAATVAAVGVGISQTRVEVPWWPFAVGAGIFVYLVMTLTWLGVRDNFHRLFGTRF